MKDIFDLLIVEDQDDEREAVECASKRQGLTVISFESGLKALEYLKETDRDALPRAFLVDMRTGDTTEELGSPLEIFNFLKNLDHIEYFRFHTGHFSEYDKIVHDITKAQIILKGDPDFDSFLEELRNSK